MKLNFLLIGMVLLISTPMFSQKRMKQRHSSEKLHAQKVAFITSHLDLTVEEAEKFWPIYNKYQEEHEALRNESRALVASAKESDDAITEDEARQIVMKDLEIEEKELKLKRSFVEEVSTVISMKKIATLKKVEREFRRSMIDNIKKRYKRDRSERRAP